MRLLQKEIPDFAFDAWIAPLAVKVADGHVVLGCQSSFHRDRVRNHYADAIRNCWQAARADAGSNRTGTDSIELLTMKEFIAASGLLVETQPLVRSGTSQRASIRGSAGTAGMRAVTTRDVAESEVMRNAVAGGGNPAQAVTNRATIVADVDRAQLSGTDFEAPIDTDPTQQSAEQRVAPALRAVPDPKRRRSSPLATPRTPPQPTPGPTRSVGRNSTDPGGHTGSADEFRLDARTKPAQPELPFSFESFIVGPCNALAREAALALARRRQRSLNQLYLGGESGMGKTHLARATAAEARRHGRHGDLDPRPEAFARGDRAARVVYTSAEQFTSEFVSAMRLGNSEGWKRRYRAPIEMLIVEDVQFFGGRVKTQLELFHTVQHVLDAGGSVLLTGDRAPRDLVDLDERIRDQLGRGFVAELEMPDAIVRRQILRSKAAAGGVHLPPDCLDLLVESSAGSVRDIESTLIQVVMTASLLGRTIDLDLTLEAIELKSGTGSSLTPKTIAPSEIVRIVAAFFGKRPDSLVARSRRRDVLVPRQMAMYLAHRYSNASFTEIGHALGRDHPAVRNAITRIERLVLENAPVRYQVEALSERIDQTLKRSDSDEA